MLDSTFLSLIIGLLLGVLAGLGVGGGSLLMLWLTLILQIEPVIARSINLLFFLPTAICSAFFRWKNASIPWKVILPAATAGCIGAAVFSLIGLSMDTTLLKKLFGILLLATALRELTYRSK